MQHDIELKLQHGQQLHSDHIIHRSIGVQWGWQMLTSCDLLSITTGGGPRIKTLGLGRRLVAVKLLIQDVNIRCRRSAH